MKWLIFMRNLYLIFYLFFSVQLLYSQDYKQFYKHADLADSAFQLSDFETAANHYLELFQLQSPKGATDFHRLPSSRAYAMSNHLDTAFEQLFYIAEGKYHFLAYYTPTKKDLEDDTLLISLKQDKRWEKLLKLIEERNELILSRLDTVLMNEIEEMRNEDQKYRSQFYQTREKYGQKSKELKELDSLQTVLDIENKRKLENIVQKYGWPGITLIGFETSYSLFLIIQHQDVEVQLKYLPLIQEKFEQGELIIGTYQMLMDRISMRQNSEQLYGTQTCYDFETKKYYLCPLFNPDSINERLYNLGLGSFEKSYKQMMGENWDVEKYKQNLLKYKAAYKRDLPK